MSELVEFIDGPLILVSWISTTAFMAIGRMFFTPGKNRFKAAWLNLVLFGVVFAAFVNLSYSVNKPIYLLPYYCYARVWNGTWKRACLLIFFVAQLFASFVFCAIQTKRTTKATTAHRKFFHFTISLIAFFGIIYDPKFMRLSAHLMLQIFIILEFLRSLQAPPWSNFLNPYLQIFVDPNQESEDFILTPILLICGVFLPILLSPVSETQPLALYHFAGIATVGIGDSLAAIIGSKFGATKFSKPLETRKSLEGSLAMLFGQGIFYSALLGFGIVRYHGIVDLIGIAISVHVCTLAEAALSFGDNVILPSLAWFIFTMH
uniref:dolichol kinase n=1 Tax=Panagrolaimus superbus TaxID=310955 RepID=A0A914Y7A7_9BILA